MALYTESGRRRILPPLGSASACSGTCCATAAATTSSTPRLPLFLAARRRRVRPLKRYGLVVDWLEVWAAAYWREYLGGARPDRRAVQRTCAAVTQRAFCFSRLHAARLREEGLRGEMTVLEGCTPVAVPRPLARREARVFAGRMIPEKRVTLGVAAVALAAERIEGLGRVVRRRARAWQAGGASPSMALEAIVSAPASPTPRWSMRDMRRALCMLLPSRREGYGMVVVEASARATPSIVVAARTTPPSSSWRTGSTGWSLRATTPRQSLRRSSRARGGIALRESTARWFAENAEKLSLESSLKQVLASYAGVSTAIH